MKVRIPVCIPAAYPHLSTQPYKHTMSEFAWVCEIAEDTVGPIYRAATPVKLPLPTPRQCYALAFLIPGRLYSV